MTMEGGRYIVIEGNDGTGKSTQVDMLAEWFRGQGRQVQIVEEPGSDDPDKSTPVANELRKVIKNGDLVRSPEINVVLFSAARRELWRERIQPALGRGAIVLSARNYFSTLAYQGRGEGLTEEYIIDMTAVFTDEHYMKPDDMIVLTLEDTAVRSERIQRRGQLENPDTFESRSGEFQDKVSAAYIDLAKKYDLATIDASGTVDEIQQKIRQILS